MSKRAFLWFMRGLALLILLGLGVALSLTLFGRLGTPTDRAVWVGNEIAGATLLLAALAAFVALEAYRLSIQVPNMSAHVKFPYCDWDKPVFATGQNVPAEVKADQVLPSRPIRADDWKAGVREFPQMRGVLKIENDSEWSARNPAVRIEVEDMGGLYAAAPWQAEKVESAGRDLYAITWEVGAAVHGKWTKQLPLTCFDSLRVFGPQPVIKIDLVAEQFSRTQVIPVEFVTFDEWLKMHPSLGHE